MKNRALALAAVVIAAGGVFYMTTRRAGSDLAQEQVSGQAGAVERGRKAYFAHCVVCHSPDSADETNAPSMMGYFKKPPAELADGTRMPRTDQAVREMIAKGTSNMPSQAKNVTGQEVEDILAYLHTL